MRLGLAARLALVFAALVAVTALATSLVGAISVQNEVSSDVDRFLRNRADDIVGGSRSQPSERGGGGRRDGRDNDDDLDFVDNDAVVQQLDAAGTVIGGAGIALPIGDVDLALAVEDGPDAIRTVSIDGVDHRMLTRHLDDGGAIQIARDLAETDELLGRLQTRSLLIGAVMSIVAGLTGWWLARRTTRPLRTLSSSVEQVASTGDLSNRLQLGRNDEIGRLSDRFDEMLDALDRSRQQQHRLVNDAAHELRTPLTSINANIDLLTHAPDLDPEMRRQTLESTRNELRQLNGLFTEIIELATDDRDAPPWERLDLASVAEQAVERFRGRSAIPVELRTEPSPVEGDRTALDRAITNLLSNAEKYGGPDGPIEVMVAAGAVTVRDHGPGIAPDDLDLVVERFYRSDSARGQPGAGLGLSIVDKIATDHGGRTSVANSVGGGAEVGFTIPVAGGHDPLTPDGSAPPR